MKRETGGLRNLEGVTSVWMAMPEQTDFGVQVHVVRGQHGVVLIDSGHAFALGSLEHQLAEVGVRSGDVQFLFNTHEHMDHIGNNAALLRLLGGRLGASPVRRRCVEDPDYAAEFFVHRFPNVRPLFDPHSEYRTWIGEDTARVSVELTEGFAVDLGGAELTVLELPGHTPAELGFVESFSGTLILGDLLAPQWLPNLYLYESPAEARRSLRRIGDLIASPNVVTVVTGHGHGPMGPEQAMDLVAPCLSAIDRIDECVAEAVDQQGSPELGEIRDAVCARLKKDQDWRALLTVMGHLDEQSECGRIVKSGSTWTRST